MAKLHVLPPPEEVPIPDPVEQSLLGSILLDNSVWDIARHLLPLHFNHPSHKAIFGAMGALLERNEPVDLFTLSEYLEHTGQLGIAQGMPYLGLLMRDTGSPVNAITYARLIVKHWAQREIAFSTTSASARRVLDDEIRLMMILDDQAKQQRNFLDITELLAMPTSLNWLIKHWLTANSLTGLFGESGAGKSFIALDWCLHIAAGRYWNGCRVQQGPVLYIAGEGASGIVRRVAAWQVAHCPVPKSQFFLSSRTVTMDEAGVALVDTELQWLGVMPVVVVIDTVARTLPGDENSAADMGKFIQCLDGIRQATGACVIAVHHSGHADKGRARGSSAFRAAMDAEFVVERDPDARIGTLKSTKSKDSTPPQPISFSLQSIQLPEAWQDQEDDEPTSSCTVTFENVTPATGSRGRHSAKEKLALRALVEAISERGEPVPGSQDLRAVSVETWREVAYRRGLKNPDQSESTARVAFMRVREHLLADGSVRCADGRYWIQP